MQKHAWRRSPEYLQYLDTQLRRTLSKKDAPLPARARALIDKVAASTDLSQCDVLCVGARNRAEVDYFRRKGARSATGIDLHSDFAQDSRILVMDMHQMSFPDNRFDLVYSSHSLEHAYDPRQVVSEIVRVSRPQALVVIEVPVQYEVRGADRLDFGDCQNLHSYFSPHLHEVLWCEGPQAPQPPGEGAYKIIRTMFSIRSGTGSSE
ncbi:MAG: class I SAM-dependent methyltransferase [Chloroflexota bacterium]